MKKVRPIHYRKVVVAFVIISLGSMLLIDLGISNSQRRKVLENEEIRADSEISLVAAMVTEPMLRYQFDYVEQFVRLWGVENDRIISLKTLSPDGVVLASYENKKSPEHFLRKEKVIFFEKKPLVTIEMTVDMTSAMENLSSLQKGLYLQSFLVSMTITLLLVVTLKLIALRPLEKEIHRRTMAEEELQHANMSLENKIEEQRKAEQLLARAKEQWECTVDAIPDFIALIDRDRKIVRINKALASIMGMNANEAIGHRFCLSSPEIKSPDEPCSDDVLLDSLEPLSKELFIKRLNGYYEVNVMPYQGPGGVIQGSVFVAHDVSERKAAEKEKDKLKSDLLHAQKLESVGRLAAGIAHEINSPIQYVTSNVEFMGQAFEDTRKLSDIFLRLLTEAKKISSLQELTREVAASLEAADWTFLVEELPQTIQQSQEGLARVSTIIKAMKEFSHPGSRSKAPVDLNRVIVTTIAVARNEWKYVADVETIFDENIPDVHCLADEMGQVFLNLLVNAGQSIAEKLSESKEMTKGCIIIRTSYKDGWVEVRISDNGMGIDESERYKIFDPFFTTKEVGKGTGQGLSIVHDVITKKHDGTISFETEVGKGTTFVVKLPGAA